MEPIDQPIDNTSATDGIDNASLVEERTKQDVCDLDTEEGRLVVLFDRKVRLGKFVNEESGGRLTPIPDEALKYFLALPLHLWPETRESKQGPTHPHTLTTSSNLANGNGSNNLTRTTATATTVSVQVDASAFMRPTRNPSLFP